MKKTMKKYMKPVSTCMEIRTQQLMATSQLTIDADTETDTAYAEEFFDFEDDDDNGWGSGFWKDK